MVEVLLIRHGETFGNAIASMRDFSCAPLHPDDVRPKSDDHLELLNSRGQQQAEALADKLCKLAIDVVFSSPLPRVRQTLLPLQSKVNINEIIEDGLQERKFLGLGSILPNDSPAAEGYWQRWSKEVSFQKAEWIAKGFDMGDFRIGESESDNEFWGRLNSVFRRISQNYDGARVLVAAHGILNQMLLNSLMGNSLKISQHNCCINAFVLESYNKLKDGTIVEVNQTDHLPPQLRNSVETACFSHEIGFR